jgi:hypothetical protein
VIGDVPAQFLRHLGAAQPARRIAELAEHPGAYDGPRSWQGTDHLRVRVRPKARSHLPLKHGDLGGHLGDDRRGGADRGTHRGRDDQDGRQLRARSS